MTNDTKLIVVPNDNSKVIILCKDCMYYRKKKDGVFCVSANVCPPDYVNGGIIARKLPEARIIPKQSGYVCGENAFFFKPRLRKV